MIVNITIDTNDTSSALVHTNDDKGKKSGYMTLPNIMRWIQKNTRITIKQPEGVVFMETKGDITTVSYLIPKHDRIVHNKADKKDRMIHLPNIVYTVVFNETKNDWKAEVYGYGELLNLETELYALSSLPHFYANGGLCLGGVRRKTVRKIEDAKNVFDWIFASENIHYWSEDANSFLRPFESFDKAYRLIGTAKKIIYKEN